ncbi:unnamed protein product [Polarella glacialis]|uniref:Uncharacterized protein n=1 Tax=Polarella glacialis TaxID=89957 RepID=A0A813JDT3_POLGL|nr:unnamed protein product [Polarella glacialis]
MFPAQSFQVGPFVVPAPQYQQLKLKESQKLEKPGGSRRMSLRLPGLGSRFEAASAAEDCSDDDFEYSPLEPSPISLWKSPRQHVAVHLQGRTHHGGRSHQFPSARFGPRLPGPRPHEAPGRGGRHGSVAGGQPEAVQH